MLYKTSFTGTPSKVNIHRHHSGAQELWTDQLLGQLHPGVMLSPPDPKGSPCVSGPGSCSTRSGTDSQLV